VRTGEDDSAKLLRAPNGSAPAAVDLELVLALVRAERAQQVALGVRKLIT